MDDDRRRRLTKRSFPDCGVCDRVPGVGHVATVFLVYGAFLLGPGETVFVLSNGARVPIDRSYRSIVFAYLRYYGTITAVLVGALTYWWSTNDYPEQFLRFTGGVAAALGGAVLLTYAARNARGERKKELYVIAGMSPPE